MEIKQNAPVIIPTLNRYDHFKRCLESLEQCTGADKTEVYVALDYPPSEKYVDGWKKNDEYLHEKEKNHGFKSLNVIRRETNYFMQGRTYEGVVEMATANIGYYILSEDDNVFSPNFLEYMNKGLIKYENDKKVLFVCGYSQPYPFQNGENTFFFHRTDVSAWGLGIWIDKWDMIEKDIRNGFFRNSFSINSYLKVRKYGYNRLCQYISYVVKSKEEINTLLIIDNVLTCYCILNDMYVINPATSKVRNMGWDITGNSFFNNEKLLKKYGDVPLRHMNQVIDSNDYFEFSGNPMQYFEHNNIVTKINSEARISYCKYIYGLLRIFWFKVIRNH